MEEEVEVCGPQSEGGKRGCHWDANPMTGTELMLPSSIQGGGRGRGQWFARPETGLYQHCHCQYRECRKVHAIDAEDQKGGMIRADMSDVR
jgi:hypothetical protein